jgi:hypothetical protein
MGVCQNIYVDADSNDRVPSITSHLSKDIIDNLENWFEKLDQRKKI